MQREEITSLAGILRRDGDRILDASSKLSLSASILGKLNETLSTIRPTDAVLNDFIDLGFLYDFVQQTLALKIFPDQHYLFNSILDVSPFGKLKLLEVHRLSLNLITGLKTLRSQLEYVTCMRSIGELRDVLETCGADRSEGFVWRELKRAVFSHNNMTSIDASLEFTPNLQSLDLSYNNITNVDVICCLFDLKYLNLANNRIEILPCLKGPLCGNLQVLILRNNYIEDFKEVINLVNLRELDLGDNCLVDYNSLLPLVALAQLRSLRLENNVICHHVNYRVKTCGYLNEAVRLSGFTLDDRVLSKKELRIVGSVEPPALYFQRCESFNSTTTASTVVQRRFEACQTSDMEVSSSSVDVTQVAMVLSPGSTIRNSSFNDQGMHDSGFEAEARPVSPSSSIAVGLTQPSSTNPQVHQPRSATSLQNESRLQTMRYSESDIEILSNPSQSSIEVLSCNAQAPRCVRSCVILPHVLKEQRADADLGKPSEESRRSL